MATKISFLRIHFILCILTMLVASGCVSKKNQVQYKATSTTTLAMQAIIADSSSATLPLLSGYKKALDATMNVVIGLNNEKLEKDRFNGTLGYMVTDAMMHAMGSKVQAAVSNHGGIRIPSLQVGSITLGKVYELMPFENTITIVQMKGEKLQVFCNKIAHAGGQPISGITFTIDSGKARNVMIGGKPVEDNKVYAIAVNSYMAAGGDDGEMLVKLPQQTTSILIRDAIVSYIKYCNNSKQQLVQLPLKRMSKK